MVVKNYYKLLDLETSNVTIEEVKIAYRAAAKKYHPDVNVGDELAEERIKSINEAYRILSVPASKRKYDRIWNSKFMKEKRAFSSKEDKNPIFGMLFGKTNNLISNEKEDSPVRGENVETEIKISLFEAFNGGLRKISLKTVEGKIRTFTINIPSGIRVGEKVRLLGQGKLGENGGKNGDLLIKILIENDKKFKLKDNDIHTDLYLSPWEAALGARVDLRGIDDEIKVYVPQGIQSGEKIKIPGKGYIVDSSTRGDLVADVKIIVPKKMSEEEKEIFERLNTISKFNPREI